MSAFDRLKNVAKGKLSQAAGDLERANPEAVYASAIDNAVARIAEHKDAAAGLMAQRTALSEKVEALEGELREVGTVLGEAIREEDDDMATVLLSRKDELEGQLAATRAERDQVALAVEETKQGLESLRQQVDALKREREAALAQLHTAQATLDVQDAVSGLSTSASGKGLESVRSSINVLNAQANEGWLDDEGNSVRGRAEAMGRKAAEQDARSELERLKREMAARKEGTTADVGDESEVEEEEAPPSEVPPKRSL